MKPEWSMSPEWSKWAPMPLRLVLGIGFIYHGLPKFTAAGHQQIAGMIEGIGLPMAGLLGWLVALAEVLGGIALIAGAFTAIVSAILIVEMAVAMFTVHWSAGFSFIQVVGMTEQGPQFGLPGIEVNLLYIAGLLALFLRGPTHLSVDQMLAEKRAAGGGRAAPTGGAPPPPPMR